MSIGGGSWRHARSSFCLVRWSMLHPVGTVCSCNWVGGTICGRVALGTTQVSVRCGSWSIRWGFSFGCAPDSLFCHRPIVFN